MGEIGGAVANNLAGASDLGNKLEAISEHIDYRYCPIMPAQLSTDRKIIP